MNIRNLYKKFMSYLKCPLLCHSQSDNKPFDNSLRTLKRFENPMYNEKEIEGILVTRVFNEFSRDINLAHEAVMLNIDNRSDRERFYIQIASMIENTLKRHSEYKEHPLYEVLQKRLEKINALQEGYKIIDERKGTDEKTQKE